MYSRSEAAFFATSRSRSFGTRPIRPPQGRCNVGTERRDTANSASSIENIRFFNKTRSVGASWAPVSQGRSLAATLYARCLMGFFTFASHPHIWWNRVADPI